MLTKEIYRHAYEFMQRNKNCCIATVFDFGVMTDMISPYLERPVRTFDRVLEDRVLEDRALEDRALEDGVLVAPEAPRPASAAPEVLPVGSNPDLDARRLDPVEVLVRLLMSGHGAEGGNESAPIEAPAEMPAAARAASRPNGRRAP